MNKELAEVIRLYSTAPHGELDEYLLGKSKNNLIAMLLDLLTMYINDKNSSTLREYVTVIVAGYNHTEEKIGYNGYKQSSILGGKPIMCEAKPKNFDTTEWEKFKNKMRKTPPSKLKGAGNFTDYTHERLEKDKKENPNMLISGFVNGKLMYILESPFNCKTFTSKLLKQLERQFSKESRKPKEFLRSADFDYRDYADCDKLKIGYLLKKVELERYKDYFQKKFYELLYERAK